MQQCFIRTKAGITISVMIPKQNIIIMMIWLICLNPWNHYKDTSFTSLNFAFNLPFADLMRPYSKSLTAFMNSASEFTSTPNFKYLSKNIAHGNLKQLNY